MYLFSFKFKSIDIRHMSHNNDQSIHVANGKIGEFRRASYNHPLHKHTKAYTPDG